MAPRIRKRKPEGKPEGESEAKRVHRGVKQLVECGICFEVRTPIFQCRNGHTFCGGCNAKLTKCGTCRMDLGPAAKRIRNRALEQLALSIASPCKWSGNGCSHEHPGDGDAEAMKAHERDCPHQDFPCEIAGCGFRGPTESFAGHWISSHGAVALPSSGVLEWNRTAEGSARFVLDEGPKKTLLIELKVCKLFGQNLLTIWCHSTPNRLERSWIFRPRFRCTSELLSKKSVYEGTANYGVLGSHKRRILGGFFTLHGGGIEKVGEAIAPMKFRFLPDQ